MHAAVDANCLVSVSPAGYWNFVDYVHAHAGEMGGEGHALSKANEELDKLTLEEGARQKVNAAVLEACVKKQDETRIKASMKVGDALSINGTPATYINGLKLNGMVPIEVVYRIIDEALIAAGQTPPPAPVKPSPAPAPKPGN
jgi:protein-disulfide isomerase